jgi:hypothetical protein
LRLAAENALIYAEIVPQVVEAVLMVVTDPPDPFADTPGNWPVTAECFPPGLCWTGSGSGCTWPNGYTSNPPTYAP